MPQIVKNSVPHILISMFVAPIMLAIFAWAGSSILGNREVTVLMPTVTKKLDEISTKQDALLVTVWENKKDIAVIKTLIHSKTKKAQ